MALVNSVFNLDGSLVVAPNVGEVEVHLNTAHGNQWTDKQEITPALPANPALVLHGKVGQTGPYRATLRSDGTLAMRERPTVSEADFVVEVLARGGQVTSYTDDSGHFFLRTPSGAQGFDVQYRPGGASKPPSTQILGTGGVLHSPTNFWVGPLGDAFAPFSPNAILQVFNSSTDGRAALIIANSPSIALRGGFAVHTGSTLAFEGSVTVNAFVTSRPVVLDVNGNHSSVGLRLISELGESMIHPALSVDDALDGPLCGFVWSGHLWTGTSEAPTTTGAIVRRWPIYGPTGSLIGYLPIYDDL